MEAIHKQEYRVRDLPTRSVTLFPTRAQVVRDIKGVSLRPGANQVTVVGLSPTVDKDSIKVEGTGSAVITDIAVELLPNREIFEEIYDTDDDVSEVETDSDEDDEDKEESPQLKELRDKLTLLRDEQKRAKEVVASADSRLKILDAHGKMLDRKRGVEIDEGLEKYRQEREKVFRDHMDGIIRDRELETQIVDLLKEEGKLLALEDKARRKEAKVKLKARKLKLKELEKKRRRREEVLKEKRRLRKEREAFWPRQCYSVRISLDATAFTPMSSRRSSVSGEVVAAVANKEPAPSAKSPELADSLVDFRLSYVTTAAFWGPSYDLALSTTANTGQLCFDAQLTNMTSETWVSCKVVLSTSQATFSGVKDAIPVLVPWRVRLAPKTQGWDDILNSREERAKTEGWQAQQNAVTQQQKPRSELFGVGPAPGGLSQPEMDTEVGAVPERRMAKKNALDSLASSSHPLAPQAQVPIRSIYAPGAQAHEAPGASGGSHGVFTVFNSSNVENAQLSVGVNKARRSSSGLFGSIAGGARSKAAPVPAAAPGPSAADSYASEADEDDGATILPEPVPELGFQESVTEEDGLTENYELSGLKTLAPGRSASKQRVVRVSFTGIAFSHTVVAKYKPVALLKVRLRNSSKLTLLKGPVGLTLDGSFMGRSTLPRCSSGDHFTMSLGVDPAIKVAYPKPEVKRSTQGLFTKEDNSSYTRTVTLVNTRAGSSARPATLIVYDQIPVSEDEKVRVELLQPRGLVAGGTGVPAGMPTKVMAATSSSAKDDKGWGQATAALRKEGIVTWDVTLNAGKGVKLSLEYAVGWPATEHVMQC